MWKFKYKQLNINYYQLNYYIMKKILFVALGATLLAAGCQKTEIINQVNPDGQPSMTFSTGLNKLTKSATDLGETNLRNQGFVFTALRAYEDIYTTTTEFGEAYDDIKNAKFSYNDGEWQISTGNSYFWPGKDRDLVFFGISSSQIDADKNEPKYKVPEITLTGEKDADGIYTDVKVSDFVITGYKVTAPDYKTTPVVEGADDDLMVCDVVIQDQGEIPVGGQKGRVDLYFNHTLSKVEFVFSTKSETAAKYPVTVNSITIEDVVTKADLNVTVDLKDRISQNIYAWGGIGNPYVTTVTDNNSAEDFVVTKNLLLTASEQTYSTWLVIPQDLTKKMVSITYTITDSSNEDGAATTFTSVWPLAVKGVVDAWEINNYVKYKVTLAPNIITFNPVLEKDWNDAVAVDPSTGLEVEDTPAPVEPTYTELKATSGETEVILYYEGTLAVDTVILVKNENVYTPAAEGDYLLEDGSTLKVGAEGKVTEIVPPQLTNLPTRV